MTQTPQSALAHHFRSNTLAAALILTALAAPVHGQPALCSSVGQRTPVALLERFISADCPACWSDPATPVAPAGALALDWIVPARTGDDAPLSAAASVDAETRLLALRLPSPASQSQQLTPVSGWSGSQLEVAQGVAVGSYVGASIDLNLPSGATPALPVQAWLALVEEVPTGTEGSPIPRNLVRNLLQPLWDARNMVSNADGVSFSELRPMNIPDGANPARLRLVGWVEDSQGHILLASHSQCLSNDN